MVRLRQQVHQQAAGLPGEPVVLDELVVDDGKVVMRSGCPDDHRTFPIFESASVTLKPTSQQRLGSAVLAVPFVGLSNLMGGRLTHWASDCHKHSCHLPIVVGTSATPFS